LTRRLATALACMAVAAISSLAGAAEAPATHDGRQPNILVILTDDQRLDGSMAVMPKTRYLFKKNGTEFKRAMVTTPLCCPSRSTFFSGRYVHNTDVHANSEADNIQQDWTLQRYFHDEGYQTGLFGKFLNAWNVWTPPAHWDRWGVFGSYVLDDDYYPTVNDQGTVKSLFSGTPYYESHWIRDKAVDFLARAERDDARPWLLYLTPKAPHPPATPEPKYASASVPSLVQPPSYFESDITDKPDWVRQRATTPSSVQTLHDKQLRTLKSVDDMVYRVFTELRRRGEEDDTLAVFVSDNGFLWGEHGLNSKSAPYSESIKVPFFMRWPSHRQLVRPGGVDQRMIANVDLTPTLLDAADVQPTTGAPPIDGRSLLDRSWQRDRLLTEYWRLGDFSQGVVPQWASIVTRDYQYVEYYQADGVTPLRWPDQTAVREYYNLNSDPYQLTNLLHDGNAGNDPATTALAAQLARDRLCSGQSCHPETQQPPLTDTVPPTAQMTAPPDYGATLARSVSFIARAVDNVGVASVQFKVDGTNLGAEDTSVPFSASWNTTGVADGQHTISAVARDVAGNSAVDSFTFTVDNTSPTGTDVQSCVAPTPCGPDPGTVENGDTLTYYFSTAVDPTSFLSGWNGSPTGVTVRLSSDVPAVGYSDALTVDQVPALGTVDTSLQDYTLDYNLPNVYPSSTMQMSLDGTSITLTLGGGTPGFQGGGIGNMHWTAGTGARSSGGTALCSCFVTESGAVDREF
jgi:arylsulfatase A-like enzyme